MNGLNGAKRLNGWNQSCLAAGALTLTFLWSVPWTAIGVGPFSAHMIVHMGIVAVAAPLLALALARSPLSPVERAPWLFPPIPVSLVEFVVVWAWHAPALHHAARRSMLAWTGEQSLFLAAGLWLWLAVFGGESTQRQSRAAAGVVALLLTTMHMSLLGALLALSPRLLYAHEATDLATLSDQHLGGAIMLLVGGISYLSGGLWLTAQLLRGAWRRSAARL